MVAAASGGGGAPTKVKGTPSPGNVDNVGGDPTANKAGVSNTSNAKSYQQAFHPNILNIHTGVASSQGNNKLLKGFMYSDDGDYPFGVRFLYNPTQIETDWSIDPNTAVLPASQLPVNDPSTAYIGGMGNLNFSLLFDRTFECWDSGYANTPAGKLGCYEDIRQFYLMTGILPKTKAGSAVFDVPASPMVPVPLYISFGGYPALLYYGRIMGFTVTYTHWTQNMTPVRAAVDLTTMMMIPPTQTQAAIWAATLPASTISTDTSTSSAPFTTKIPGLTKPGGLFG